jgi:hypothetical protein
MNLLEKFKETALSVIPVMGIVILLGVTVAPLEKNIIVNFLIGGILLIVGLTLFLVGVDIGILPIGERSGAALTAKRNLPLLLSVAFAIGVMVTIAEPDVQVLAVQIKGVSPEVNKWLLVFMIALGFGLLSCLDFCGQCFPGNSSIFLLFPTYLFLFWRFLLLKNFRALLSMQAVQQPGL